MVICLSCHSSSEVIWLPWDLYVTGNGHRRAGVVASTGTLIEVSDDDDMVQGKRWPTGKVRPTACVCQWSFIGTQLPSLIYIWSVAGFVLQGQTGVVVAWLTKLKIFMIWPCIEKVWGILQRSREEEKWGKKKLVLDPRYWDLTLVPSLPDYVPLSNSTFLTSTISPGHGDMSSSIISLLWGLHEMLCVKCWHSAWHKARARDMS